jgi:hypothetical protein
MKGVDARQDGEGRRLAEGAVVVDDDDAGVEVDGDAGDAVSDGPAAGGDLVLKEGA